MKKTKMLKKNYEFKNVLSKGTHYYGKFIQVVVKKNNNPYNLIGIAISVKVAKAVKRNRIKRLIRESYRFVEDSITEGNSLVFLWNKNASVDEVTFYDIKEDLINILKKMDIIKEKA